MTYKEYLDLTDRMLPDLNIKKVENLRPPEAVKIVALELYLTPIDQLCIGVFPLIDIETRKQLHSLRENGVHCFEKK